jgi:galactose mutarotase-like enzyme
MLYQLYENGITAVVDTYGGELISFQDSDKTEYLWSGNPAFWTGRSPHLFPIIGTTKNSSSLTKHGFVRTQELSLLSYTNNEISLSLTDTPDTLSCYPYSFSITITHKLLASGFTTQYTIKNTGSIKMPFFIGGHVGFACPLQEGECFQEYSLFFPSKEMLHPLVSSSDSPLDEVSNLSLQCDHGHLPLSYELFDSGALILNPSSVSEVSLIHEKTKKGIHFSFPDFPVLALWTMPHKNSPYLCLEPWHGMPALTSDGDSLFDKPYVTILEPSMQKQFAYHMKII